MHDDGFYCRVEAVDVIAADRHEGQGALHQFGAALLEVLPGDPAKPAELVIWQRPAPVKPEFYQAIIDVRKATIGK